MHPHIVGVRHYSPACARLVAQRIAALRPAHVLIEGPADFNHRQYELALPHQLPIAIYSYLSTERQHRASWTPFAEHSPEWQALQAARATGAQAHFIDLPAWHDAFAGIENRYADAPESHAEQAAARYNDALCEQLGIDNIDALWDHLFEDETDTARLSMALERYFEHMRGDDPGSPGNQVRERMMARWIAWAMARNDGPVVVVCGGYHAPALRTLWRVAASEERMPGKHALPPPTPQPDAADARQFGSFLVPYTYHRLDAFAGYASGMPAPYFYQLVWEHGPQAAGAQLLQLLAQRLRGLQLPLSSADLIAAQVRAAALARLRGHAHILRCDWLDALAGALLDEALDRPLPWTTREPLQHDADPLIVEIIATLAGARAGALAPGTSQPPLLAAVEAELAAHGIAIPGDPELDLLQPQDRSRSRILHRLLLLELPGINRASGRRLALEGDRYERWTLRAPIEQRAALIEAAVYGATLADAARARLEDSLRQAAHAHGTGRLGLLAAVLNRAAFAGLPELAPALLDELALAVAGEGRFEAIGRPLAILNLLLHHGHLLDFAAAPVLHTLVAAAFDRALWLLEGCGQVTAADQLDHIETFLALQAVASTGRHNTGIAAPTPDPARAVAVWQRKLADPLAAALSRGAALGAIAGSGAGGEPATVPHALALLRTLAPEQLGDALTGLLALARDQLAQQPQFIAGLDAMVVALDAADFMLALPAMRSAFAWLPPAERGALADAVLVLHQAQQSSAQTLVAPLAGIADHAERAALIESAALQKLAVWGITP